MRTATRTAVANADTGAAIATCRSAASIVGSSAPLRDTTAGALASAMITRHSEIILGARRRGRYRAKQASAMTGHQLNREPTSALSRPVAPTMVSGIGIC